MKAVIDTNVVVSGTFWTGASFKVLEMASQEIISIIVTLPILEEYDKIVNSEEILEKTHIYQQAKTRAQQDILSKAIVVEPKEKIKFINEDPDDDKFLEAAVEGKADYIISQDRHLLKIGKFREVKIITPEDALKIINK